MAHHALLTQIASLEQNLERIEQTFAQLNMKSAVGERFLHMLRVRASDLARLKKTHSQKSDPWRVYAVIEQKVYSECIPECLELLGGWAIRESNIDQDICKIADALMKQYADNTSVAWDSLTVLGIEHEFRPTADIIRLRFPEWDIWNLPFLAHEFGHYVAETRRDFKDFEEFVEGEEDIHEDDALPAKSYIHELYADVFATYTFGPAYGLAVVLLRFNPSLANEEGKRHPPQNWRVAFILNTLEKMDAFIIEKNGGLKGPFEAARKFLRKLWEDSVPPGERIESREKDEQSHYKRWFRNIYSLVVQEKMYDEKGWGFAVELSVKLARGEPLVGVLTGNEELKDVINGAWLYRLQDERAVAIEDKIKQSCLTLIGDSP